MGCVQNKNTLKNAKNGTATSSSLHASRMQVYRVKQSGNNVDQGGLSDTHLSDEQNHKANHTNNRISHSRKQTQIDPISPEVDGNSSPQDCQSPSRKQQCKSHTAAPSYYPVTLEYVLARKSFVESQHISEDQRLNMFPAPKLKAVSKSSLIHRRKLTQNPQAAVPIRSSQQRQTSKI